MPPKGEAAEGAAVQEAAVWANLRPGTLLREKDRRPQHRTVWPPILLNIMAAAGCPDGMRNEADASEAISDANIAIYVNNANMPTPSTSPQLRSDFTQRSPSVHRPACRLFLAPCAT